MKKLLFAAAMTMLAGALPGQQPAQPTDQNARDLKFVKAPPIKPVNADGSLAIPRSYALVIGIAQYPNLPPKGQLQFPERDAASIYTALISQEGGRFPPENVHRLYGKDATLKNIRYELEQWLPSVTKDDDRVLIYFAGHGFLGGDGKAYLAPEDIDLQNLAGSAYPMDELGRAIGTSIKGKWKVLMTDACHSGAITPEADTQQINTSLLNLNKSLFSMTASRDREQSFESERWGGGHGAFTWFLIQGIQGEADANRDGVVTADELAEYVRVNVRRETNARQNPTGDRGSFDPNMVLAYNPNHAPTTTEQSAFGSLVVETNMDGVEVFVDDQSRGKIDKGKQLNLPGLTPGKHWVKAVRMGYEPDGPREVVVYPGQPTTVTTRIVIAIRPKKAAVDEFDKGMKFYQNGYEKNYQKAVEHFQNAINLEPKYSKAYLYLARAYNALTEEDKAKAAFAKAVEIDPDYAEAHSSFGGMLLDLGDVDQSIRELNRAITLEPNDAMTDALLAVAFTRNQMVRPPAEQDYKEAEKYARAAIALNPKYGEAHLALAEALRRKNRYLDAKQEYEAYLKLSAFDSGVAGKLNYYVLGSLIGFGKKTRAAQTDIWKELQFTANFGMCDCERLSKNWDASIRYCEIAAKQDPSDPYAHYNIGWSLINKFNNTKDCTLLGSAKSQFENVVQLSPEIAEAANAKTYISKIDKLSAICK